MILRFWRVVRLWHGFNEQRAKKGHTIKHLKHLHHENEIMKGWVQKRYGKEAAEEMELILELHEHDESDSDGEHGLSDDHDYLPEGVDGIDNVEDIEGAYVPGAQQEPPKPKETAGSNGHNSTNGS